MLLCFSRWDVQQNFINKIRNTGFIIKNIIVWDKVIHGMGDLKGAFAYQYETIIFATKGRFIFPSKRPKDVLRFQRVAPLKLLHPNEKPIELIEHLIEHCSVINDIVLDPFIGSGTTAAACKKLKRKYIGFEISKEYYEITKNRVQTSLEWLDELLG